MTQWIDEETYAKFKQVMPIPCVDLVIWRHSHEDGRPEILLCLRTNEPAKGFWWTPGGRLFKGETLEQAARRKAQEELGMEIELGPQLGTLDDIFEEAHTPCTIFAARPKGDEIRLDSQHSKWRWSQWPDPELHPYVLERLARFWRWYEDNHS